MSVLPFTRSAAAGMILAAGAALVVAVPAAAQQTMRITASFGDGGPASSGQVTKRGVEKYTKLLGLSEDQKQAVTALHEGYQAAYQDASKELSTSIQEAQRSAEDTHDWSVFQEKMPAVAKKFADRTRDLEKQFFGDVQAVLTPEQTSQWPKVERQRRRETTLRTGTLSGEAVDLLDVVDGLKLGGTPDAPLAEALDEYEQDLDRSLQAKQKVVDDLPPMAMGGPMDMNAIQERMAKMREAGMKVREVNQRHARKLEALLPEDKKPVFEGAVRRESFPTVYRPSRVSKLMDTVQGFDDLDGNQKQSLGAIRSAYERDLASANDKWASAIEEEEKSGKTGGIAFAGGGTMQIGFGGDEKGPAADARKARRELDDKTRERVQSLLNASQKERLPKAQEHEMGDEAGTAVGGEAIFIRSGGG